MKCLTKAIGTALAVGAFFAGASSVSALTTLRMSANSGVSWVTIRDSASNPDGNVSFNGSIGASGWSVVASGASALGPVEEPMLNLSGVTVSSTRSGTLLIEFTQTGYGPLPAGSTYTTTLNSHNVDSGRTTVWSYLGLGNTLFQRGTLLGATVQNASTDDVDSSIVTNPLSAINQAYSLTIRVAIFHSGAGVSSFNIDLIDPNPPTEGGTPVPEGGTTLSLLGMAFLAFTALVRFTRKAAPSRA